MAKPTIQHPPFPSKLDLDELVEAYRALKRDEARHPTSSRGRKAAARKPAKKRAAKRRA